MLIYLYMPLFAIALSFSLVCFIFVQSRLSEQKTNVYFFRQMTALEPRSDPLTHSLTLSPVLFVVLFVYVCTVRLDLCSSVVPLFCACSLVLFCSHVFLALFTTFRSNTVQQIDKERRTHCTEHALESDEQKDANQSLCNSHTHV